MKRKIENYPLENKNDKYEAYPDKFIKININYDQLLTKIEKAVNDQGIIVHKQISSHKDLEFINKENYKIFVGNNQDLWPIANNETKDEFVQIERFLKKVKFQNYILENDSKVKELSIGYQNFITDNFKSSLYVPEKIFRGEDRQVFWQSEKNIKEIKPNLKIVQEYDKYYTYPSKGYFNFIERLNDRYDSKNTFFFITDIFRNKYTSFILEMELISRFLAEMQFENAKNTQNSKSTQNSK